MVTKTLAALLLIALGVVVGVAASDVFRAHGSETPKRPTNVPQNTQWAGGADGGVWVQCNPIDKGALACRVYADVTGVLMEDEGEFIINYNAVRPIFYSAGLIGAEVRFERNITTGQPDPRK